MAMDLDPSARAVGTAGGALIGASLLGGVVSGISGFFDGQLGREDLGTGHVVGQVVFVTVAWATAVVAVVRLWRLRRTVVRKARVSTHGGSGS